MALGDFHPQAALEPLIACALFDRDLAARHAAVASVMTFHHPGVVYPFVRGLSHAQEAVRMASLEAIEALRDPRAAGPLIANLVAPSSGAGSSRGYVSFGTQTPYVSDYDVEIAQGAAIAKPVIGVLQHGSVLDVKVIGSFASRSLTEQEATRRALVAVTGKDYGLDRAAWRAWWHENRDRYVTRTDAPGTANSR
ncbi:MAG: HEAT repeat domain-containing protein [Planctomycetota bacterium]